jgi:DUF2933 family protein
VSTAHDAPASREHASRARWVFAGFFVIATYLVVSEHRAHLVQALPWLLLLLCPLMHVYMHSGHAAHRGPDHES